MFLRIHDTGVARLFLNDLSSLPLWNEGSDIKRRLLSWRSTSATLKVSASAYDIIVGVSEGHFLASDFFFSIISSFCVTWTLLNLTDMWHVTFPELTDQNLLLTLLVSVGSQETEFFHRENTPALVSEQAQTRMFMFGFFFFYIQNFLRWLNLYSVDWRSFIRLLH